MKIKTLTFRINIKSSQQTIFNYVSDWERQSDWIMFTTVKLVSGAPQQKDSILLATTKLGPLKVADTMVVTDWQPYERIVVEHTGRIILGKGVFTISKIANETCEFTWQEITPVPFGFVGHIGLLFVQPILNVLFGRSLKILKSNIEAQNNTC